MKNKKILIGSIGLSLLIIFALSTPFLSTLDANNINLNLGMSPPSLGHFLGTDKLGRDLLLRIFIGLRISLTVAIMATFVGVFLGTLIGCLSGVALRKIDFVIMKVVDILNSIPLIFVIIVISMVFNRDIKYIILGLSLVTWPELARIVRNKVVQIKQYEFILAAKILGESSFNIVFKHILPSLRGCIYLNFMLSIPNMIINETFLSFLGLGVRPPMSSIGNMIAFSVDDISSHPLTSLSPIIFLVSLLLLLHLLGEGLKESLEA